MTDADLHAAILRREELGRNLTHGKVDERGDLLYAIVAELYTRTKPFTFAGRAWSLMRDLDCYAEIDPATGMPIGAGGQNYKNLLWDYSEPVRKAGR